MDTVTISPKVQVVLPRRLREEMGLLLYTHVGELFAVPWRPTETSLGRAVPIAMAERTNEAGFNEGAGWRPADGSGEEELLSTKAEVVSRLPPSLRMAAGLYSTKAAPGKPGAAGSISCGLTAIALRAASSHRPRAS